MDQDVEEWLVQAFVFGLKGKFLKKNVRCFVWGGRNNLPQTDF